MKKDRKIYLDEYDVNLFFFTTFAENLRVKKEEICIGH